MLIGKINDVRPVLIEKRLKIIAKIHIPGNNIFEAFLPERETAAFLPREIILLKGKKADRNILRSIDIIVSKFIKGREVKIVYSKGRYYFYFLSWKNVVFNT